METIAGLLTFGILTGLGLFGPAFISFRLERRRISRGDDHWTTKERLAFAAGLLLSLLPVIAFRPLRGLLEFCGTWLLSG